MSIKLRGYDNICLLNANDADVFDFIQNYPHGAKHIHTLSLRCCNLTDRGLEALMEFLQSLYSLEINGCNEITEQGLWSSLHPRLVSLTVTDCINVADECICAITQLLPALYEFNLQAYHVTDSALSYFSPKQTGTMNVMRLQSCWEITNHGLVNIGKDSKTMQLILKAVISTRFIWGGQEFRFQLELDIFLGFNGIISVIFSRDHCTLGFHPRSLTEMSSLFQIQRDNGMVRVSLKQIIRRKDDCGHKFTK